jgi:PAS domain S-box-containing protein
MKQIETQKRRPAPTTRHQKKQRRGVRKSGDECSFNEPSLLHDSGILPLALWRADGSILDANDAYLALIGYNREELDAGALQWNKLLIGDLDAAFTRSHRAPFEEIYILRNGDQKWVLTGRTVLRKSPNTVLVFAVDITEHKRIEARLQAITSSLFQLSRDMLPTALHELSAWVVHEISQPLMAIMADAQTALRIIHQPDHESSALELPLTEISSAARRASQILRRLRTLLVAQEPNKQEVDLNPLIADLVDLLRESGALADVAVHLTLEANLPQVSADHDQLRQVFLHLILNAVEAMQSLPVADRSLSIATSRLDLSTITITFTDTGPGIPQLIAARVFEALVTTKPGAAGMGLHIVRSIIASHGGNVWVEERSKPGAAFHLSLPILSPPA